MGTAAVRLMGAAAADTADRAALRRIRLTRRLLRRVGLHRITTRLLSRNGGRVRRSCRDGGRLLPQHETKDARQAAAHPQR